MTEEYKHHYVDVSERRHRVYLNRRQLERLILDAVAANIGLAPGTVATGEKVDIREVTEGSPGYRVGYDAHVEIVLPLPAPKVAP